MVDFLQCCFNPIAGVNVGRVHFRRAYALRFRHKKQLVRVSKTAVLVATNTAADVLRSC